MAQYGLNTEATVVQYQPLHAMLDLAQAPLGAEADADPIDSSSPVESVDPGGERREKDGREQAADRRAGQLNFG